MNTKLIDGLLALPKEAKRPLRWPKERNMIPNRMRELLAQGVRFYD